MPVIGTIGSGSSFGFRNSIAQAVVDGQAGSIVAYQSAVDASGYGTANSQIIGVPSAGYTGLITIYLAGSSTAIGNWWSPDSKGGTDASGETAVFNYQCVGDETSFTLRSSTAYGTNGVWSFTVNGGVNNALFCQVGSGGPSNSFGHAAPPPTRVSTSSSVFVRDTTAGGAYARTGSLSYSDNTTYTSVGAPYGQPTKTFTHQAIDGSAWSIVLRGSTSSGGMQYTRTVVNPSSASYGVSTGDSASRKQGVNGPAGAIIVWR